MKQTSLLKNRVLFLTFHLDLLIPLIPKNIPNSPSLYKIQKKQGLEKKIPMHPYLREKVL